MNLILIVIALIFVYWILSSILRSLFRQTVTLSFASKKEAQDRIKSLKVEKRELSTRKRELSTEIKSVKLNLQKDKPKKPSRKRISRRNFYTDRSYKNAVNLENHIKANYLSKKESYEQSIVSRTEPLEREKIKIDNRLVKIDSEILLIEAWLAKHS